MTAENFKQLIMPHYRDMYYMAIRLTGDSADAEDAVQDAVLSLWHKQSRLVEAENTRSYIMTVARNAALDILRRKKPSLSLDSAGEHVDDGDIVRKIENRDRVRHVMQIIDDLPEAQRRVIIMRDVDECEFDEIVDTTGFSYVNVRTLLSRARASIRKHFESL